MNVQVVRFFFCWVYQPADIRLVDTATVIVQPKPVLKLSSNQGSVPFYVFLFPLFFIAMIS